MKRYNPIARTNKQFKDKTNLTKLPNTMKRNDTNQ